LAKAIHTRDNTKNSISPVWSDHKHARSAINMPLMGNRGRKYMESLKTNTTPSAAAESPAPKTFLGMSKGHAVAGGLGAVAGAGAIYSMMKPNTPPPPPVRPIARMNYGIS